MTNLRFSTMLLCAACLLAVHSSPAAADPPVVFSPGPTGGGTPFFSIALPAGWQMASDGRAKSSSEQQRTVQFVFKPAAGETPYLFVSVNDCGTAAAQQQFKLAQLRAQRRFLSAVEPDTDYFDGSLNVLWRVGESRNAPHVTAVGYGERVVTFKCFFAAGQLGQLTPLIQSVVENIRVHSAGAAAADYGVSADLFASPESGLLNKSLFWGLPVVLLALFAVERSISRRRHREEMAKIDADVEARKAERAKPHPQLADAEAYYQDALAKRRNRKG